MHINGFQFRDGALYIEVELYDRIYVVPLAEWLKLMIELAERATEYLKALPRG